MWKALNAGLTKLGFKEIRENQRKVVEAYVSGRDVLMVAPTGSGKICRSTSLHLYWIFTNMARNLVDTVCLVIFPLVSLMKDQVSILREKGVKAVVLGPETSVTENKKLQRENTTSCLRVPRRYLAVTFPQYWHCRTKFGRYSSMRFTVWRNG